MPVAAGELRKAPPAEKRRIDLYICLLLSAVTLAVYSRVINFDFVNFDDPEYVTANFHVRAGLTWQGIVWAFTSFHAANWSPLTWLSHMADCQLFGMRAGWHHLTSVLLHALAAVLLFAALKRMTGARWPSSFAAFLFALHPLHIESVAWISERKDVLCALFWFLALWCYARYVERPGVVRYLLVLLAFCLGLMAKPMIVTLPAVLLLVDVWPLGRAKRLGVLWEKLPFFALAAGSAAVTFLAQGRAVQPLAAIPIGLRIENALVTYATYIVRSFWPAKLAVFYPYRYDLPLWQAAASAILLAGITAAVAARARSHPYLVTGWLWYLVTLIPVIGLIQVGSQSSADRYTYVPMTGLAIMLAWGAADLLARRPSARMTVAVASAAACSACLALTWFQLQYWTDGESLFRHAAEVTSGNYIAHNNLANFYLTHKRNREAAEQSYETLRIRPSYADGHTNLATALMRMGELDESEKEYRAALGLKPASVEAHIGYGALLVARGRAREALREFSTAVELGPEYPDAHYNLGRVLAALGRPDEAAAQFYEAVRLRPDEADIRHSLGMVLLSRGRLDEALAQFRAEARLMPDDPNVHYRVGTLLASAGQFDEAIAQFSEALRIEPDLEGAKRGLEMAQARRYAPK
jgi:tetratricopeptide (TPR) repeat protein